MMRFIRHDYTQLVLATIIVVAVIILAVHFNWAGNNPCDMEIWGLECP